MGWKEFFRNSKKELMIILIVLIARMVISLFISDALINDWSEIFLSFFVFCLIIPVIKIISNVRKYGINEMFVGGILFLVYPVSGLFCQSFLCGITSFVIPTAFFIDFNNQFFDFINLIVYFIIGVIVGFIISKLKSKK